MVSQRSITRGTLAALGFIFLLSAPVDAQISLSDDFNDPATSKDKWEVITGDWKVADGVYHQLSTTDPWLVSMVAAGQWKKEWVEYTIEFDVKPLTTGDAPINVLFRVRDPVPRVWADRTASTTHFYRWIVNGWTNTESRPYLYDGGAGKLYLALEDSAGKTAVATNNADLTATSWTEWKVPLSSMMGVNLARIKKLSIGVGDRNAPVKGGAGRLYLDDIRVTKP